MSDQRSLPHHWSLTTALLTALVAFAACVEDNEGYCADDQACQRRAATDPAAGAVCHPAGHFCHEGCKADADCRDPQALGYLADRRFCDRARGHCLADPSHSDAGLDARPDAAADAGDARVGENNGAACAEGSECRSGHCSGAAAGKPGICCDRACDGACDTCATGACRPRAAGNPCGEPRCAEGLLTEHRCTADGTCTAREQSCGGYRCQASDDACRDTCDAVVGCVAGFECRDAACHEQ